MTDLSPAAQAVFSAWAKPVAVDRSLVISGQALQFQAQAAVAAALRAAAQTLAYEAYGEGWFELVVDVRDIYTIADELEKQTDEL
jgi:hypothetical protein